MQCLICCIETKTDKIVATFSAHHKQSKWPVHCSHRQNIADFVLMPKLHHLKQKPIGKSKLIKEEKKFCSTHIVDIKKRKLASNQ